MKNKDKNKSIIIFENFPVRRKWVEKEEKWYFSVIDIIAVLTGQADYKKAQSYWTTLKNRLKNEGSQVVTNCDKLKLIASDGKKYLTDVANVETILRLVQSVPSKKAEPIKLWLAKVGYERMQETVNPELAVNRARENWQKMGAPVKWIEQRMRGQEIRNKLTDYWQVSGVKQGMEYAKLTDIIHREWSGLTTKQHKDFKKLDKENLRDTMTEAELIFTALAELSTTQIAKKDEAKGYDENSVSAKKGGSIAKGAREQLEKATGEKVVSDENYLTEGIKSHFLSPKGKAQARTINKLLENAE
ncbi:MAG: BRO family protein [Patescibacteria group bacterium]